MITFLILFRSFAMVLMVYSTTTTVKNLRWLRLVSALLLLIAAIGNFILIAEVIGVVVGVLLSIMALVQFVIYLRMGKKNEEE